MNTNSDSDFMYEDIKSQSKEMTILGKIVVLPVLFCGWICLYLMDTIGISLFSFLFYKKETP